MFFTYMQKNTCIYLLVVLVKCISHRIQPPPVTHPCQPLSQPEPLECATNGYIIFIKKIYNYLISKLLQASFRRIVNMLNYHFIQLLGIYFLHFYIITGLMGAENLPGMMLAIARVVNITVIMTLSAKGSRKVPKLDICPLKFLATYPSSF